MKPLKTIIVLSAIAALGAAALPAQASPELAAEVHAVDDVDGATTVITAEAVYAAETVVGTCNVAIFPAHWDDVDVRCWAEDTDTLAQYDFDLRLIENTLLGGYTTEVKRAVKNIGAHENLKLCVEVSRGLDTSGPVCSEFLV